MCLGADNNSPLPACRFSSIEPPDNDSKAASPLDDVNVILFIAGSCDALTTPNKDTSKNNIKIIKIDFSILLILSPPYEYNFLLTHIINQIYYIAT